MAEGRGVHEQLRAAPALTWLLSEERYGRNPDGTPWECAGFTYECPFASETPGETYPPNSADPGEGYYDCALLGLKRIWGEQPKCSAADWRAKARAELDAVLVGRVTEEQQ